MTNMDLVRCADKYFHRVLYGLGPHISNYPEQVIIAWILINWCPTYILIFPFLTQTFPLNPQRCRGFPDSLDAPCCLRTADNTAVLASMHMSRTGIFHILFALFFLTLTATILQVLSYQPHYTRSNPFRLLTPFPDNKKTRVLNP